MPNPKIRIQVGVGGGHLLIHALDQQMRFSDQKGKKETEEREEGEIPLVRVIWRLVTWVLGLWWLSVPAGPEHGPVSAVIPT